MDFCFVMNGLNDFSLVNNFVFSKSGYMSAIPFLPHLSQKTFLTDGGSETTFIFHEGIDLPFFASFDLLKDNKGISTLINYYRTYLNIAEKYSTGFILESPTWRASEDWIQKVGSPLGSAEQINKKAIALLKDLRNEYEDKVHPIIISGCVGPRGDGYKPGLHMSVEEAVLYHYGQVKAFSEAGADVVTAMTLNYIEEAIGIVKVCNQLQMPVVISFTVETDGRLATGMGLREAIHLLDHSVEQTPIYYMINCAHPSHFLSELSQSGNKDWMYRIRGIRANASCKSHAELDESTELDRGNIDDLSNGYLHLKQLIPHLNVFGGCCGTDHEHVENIAKAVVPITAY